MVGNINCVPNTSTIQIEGKPFKFTNRWLPVAMRLSPGARIAPGGRMKQLFGAVV